jgi:hypothetical protein
MKWKLAKRKLIVHVYGTHNNTAPMHDALLSDISLADVAPPAPLDLPTLEEGTDVYDDREASLPFNFVAFSSSFHTGRDLSDF